MNGKQHSALCRIATKHGRCPDDMNVRLNVFDSRQVLFGWETDTERASGHVTPRGHWALYIYRNDTPDMVVEKGDVE